MTRHSLCLFAASTLLASSVVFAQQSGSAPAPRREIPAPTNLKVLPKDTTGPQVIAIMRGYAGALGVECSYCHARDQATGRPNFASDANPMKDRARVMMKMTNAINAEYLTQLTDPKPENPVMCGTCHRGMAIPEVFVPKSHEHHEAAPAAAPTTPPQSR